MKGSFEKAKKLLIRIIRTVRLFLYGSFELTLKHHIEKEMARRMDFFMMICFGDLIGLPVPSYLTFRLLPFFLKELPYWQRRMARGKETIYDRMAEFAREF
ncbi:MAG: hypothetical protein GXO76_09305 [Calditrichaeota bacterium]|nr:hypothetical protein [Calditrichota bacterium]